MPCVCCRPQCAIRGVADSIQFKFGNTQTKDDFFSGSHPCFSSGSLSYCPSGAVPDSFLEAFNFYFFNQPRDVNFDAGSGDCSRYDGTYVIDLDDGPTSGGYYWCTALWFGACANVPALGGGVYAGGPYAMGSSIGYSVGCDGASATHRILGYTVGVEHVASLVRVDKGGPPPVVPPTGNPYLLQEIVSGPEKIASDNFFDWYVSRYRQNIALPFLLGYEQWFSDDPGNRLTSAAFCQVTTPEITLQ